jgi:hypothetical protein
MPPVTRWSVKLSLVYFLAALLVGLAQAAQQPLGLPPVLAALGPVYVHLLVVGWITQMIFGVAYWMFPRFSKETPRGSDALALAAFVGLNGGLLLRVVAEPMHTLHPLAAWGWVLAVSAAAQWGAGVAFALNTWPRVKEKP